MLVVLAVGAAVSAVVLTREPPVEPVAQDRSGPVLLVPGYGGSTAGVDALASALREGGRAARVVPSPGDGRGDLREHAALLARAAEEAVAGGAPSVDVVGYSAGGVVARWFVGQLGGDALTRRVITLSSPHHGTDLAALATGSGCPVGCEQLAPTSDLLATLNRSDETPTGPSWVALWTDDDATVVPPSSGRLEGAVSFALQDVCPGLAVEHGAVPDDPVVVAIVEQELAAGAVGIPDAAVCGAS